MTLRPGRSTGLLLTFGVLSLAAVLTGAAAGEASGGSASSWLRNLLAWAAGAVAAVALAGAAGPKVRTVALVAAPLGLLATLFGEAQEGVHRWVDLGPLHINVAMLLGPAAVVAFAVLGRDRRWPWIAAFGALLLLVLQPDASQATALAAAVIPVAAFGAFRAPVKVGLAGAAVVLAAASWFRPDDLAPIAEVEGVIGLAYAASPLLALVAVVLLAAAACTPAVFARRAAPEPRLAGRSLSLLLLLTAAAPMVGAFPVPLAGIGMSAPVGAWLGVGLLAALLRRNAAGAP